VSPAGTDAAGTEDSKPPEAEVYFKAPSATTLLKVGGRKLEPNKTHTFAPGEIKGAWWCSKKGRPEGSFTRNLKSGKNPTIVLTCRKGSR
jgi:hypothetical protein